MRDLEDRIVRENQPILLIKPYVLGMEDNDQKGKTLKATHIAEALMAAVRAAETGGLLQDTMLFDLYKPQQAQGGLVAGEKSLAVRLTLADPVATLTDEQIDAAVKAVIDNIARHTGGRLR